MEQDEFIKTFFRKGAKLTDELVKERELLHERILLLEEENAHLRAQVASDEAIRELLLTIKKLESEKAEIIGRYREAEHRTHSHQATLSEIEQQLASLANLYVASYQLHASLHPKGVVLHIKELLGQLIGAHQFIVYLIDQAGQWLVPLTSDGFDRNTPPLPVAAEDGVIGRCFLTGIQSVTDNNPSHGSEEAPAACIPLFLESQTRGMIVVQKTLEQKSEFVSTDYALFKLLGDQAISALLAAHLYSDQKQPITTLFSFQNLGV